MGSVSQWPGVFVGPTAPVAGVIQINSIWQELSLFVGLAWDDTSTSPPTRRYCSSLSPVTFAAYGGATHDILSATHSDALAGTVVLGDVVHGNVTPAWARLAGNTTTAKQFLTQTGTGAVSAVPAWAAIVAGDVPDISATYATVAGDVYSGAHDFGAATSLEVPNGAGGTTVDAAGEACVDTTSRTLNFHDGTAEVVIQPVLSKSITVEDPTATEDIGLFFVDDAVTITKIVAVLVGSATPSVTWTVRHGTDRSAAGAEVVTGGTVTTSVTTGSVVTSFNDATVVADSFLWLETTAKSGTVDSLEITVFYRQDP